ALGREFESLRAHHFHRIEVMSAVPAAPTSRRSHMKRFIRPVALCVLLLGVPIQAQAQQGPPTPGPEVERLAYFVGNWNEQGKSTAHGMEGPVSSTQSWEWTAGGFFIEGHSDNKSP